jgi:hypothetical protein
MNPFVFLVGCLRSGTTLLQRIVDAHPQIAIIHETQWVPRWYEGRVGLTPEGNVTPQLVTRLLEHPRFSRLQLDADAITGLLRDDEPVHYSRFVSDLFDLYGKARGKRLVGEKSPGYVRHVKTLHELWPDAKIVHLIRDGRDVCLSVLDWRKGQRIVGSFPTWEEDPVVTVALWWEWHVRLGRQAGSGLGAERYMELRYESLVADPEGESERISGFLGVPYDERMLRFHEGRMRSKPGLSAKSAWLPVTPGLRSWSEQMGSENVRRFEAVAGPFLHEVGYARAVPSPPAEDVQRGARLREAFSEYARTRGRPIPARWEDNLP